ncbi:aspartic proteinase PCS1-like [Tasmannia lanceolata]|uniref:aspartic proteinase PCS1-like n=1 Tax=Tasmannia lanceolata TaxID=3420 RepID=UPI0040634BE8
MAFPLLLLLLQSFISYSTTKPIILPLKNQKIPSMSLPKPPNKLFFHHNISLTFSLSIGTPPQNITMVIDTGSELSWLHCKKSPNTQNFFNPLLSSSYSLIPCSSQSCQTQTRDFPIPPSCDSAKLCHVILAYADESSTEGNLASETFRFGDSAVPGTVFGCMDTSFSSTPLEDSKNTGLMGMNRGALSFVSQIGVSKFSYCISDSDPGGVLLFGDANFTWLRPLNYTPLIQISLPLPYFDRVAYSVQLEGIRVSDKLLQLPKSFFVPDHTGAGQTMVDSGTQFTFLLGPVYTALKNEFLNQTKGILKVLDEPNFVFQGAFDLCFRVNVSEPIPALPTVVLMFRGVEVSILGGRLLYRVAGEERGGDGVYCFTFGNSDLVPLEAYIIGHHQQHDMWVEYDLKNSRVGFAPMRCDLAAKRLFFRV